MVIGSSRNSLHLMEIEGSLLYSQVPAICPYPEPDPSSNLIISEYSHVLKLIPFLHFVCVCT